MKYYLAIDLGASSGRHIVGWEDENELKTEEVYRFPIKMEMVDGHLIWDMEYIFHQVKTGISEAFSRYESIESLAIDCWGVDYVLMNGDEEILPCYAYRDERTKKVIDKVHAVIPFEELYRKTGCQFQLFNTIYQMYDDLLSGRLEQATDFLMLPEYLSYKLTGVKLKEYTEASTTGMLNARTGQYDRKIIEDLGYPSHLFGPLSAPGTTVGELLPKYAEELGGTCKVVLCASHDTASAVEGIPMEGEYPYISSGTWSLLGVKSSAPHTDTESMNANYTNEGGVGYIRYQKNIMGMWLVQCLKLEICPETEFAELVKYAESSSMDKTVDPNNERFFAPDSMKAEFDASLGFVPESIGDYFRCAYLSLAEGYKNAEQELERNTGKKYDTIYIVGGGAKNEFLNRATSIASGMKVIALPIEATALGNIKVQMEESK